jgi:N-methylhydantoinase A
VEVVTLRVRAVGPTPAPAFELLPAGDLEPTPLAEQAVWFETAAGLAACPARLYARGDLRAGQRLAGPALVVQLDATTVIPPDWSGAVDAAGHLLLSCNST